MRSGRWRAFISITIFFSGWWVFQARVIRIHRKFMDELVERGRATRKKKEKKSRRGILPESATQAIMPLFVQILLCNSFNWSVKKVEINWHKNYRCRNEKPYFSIHRGSRGPRKVGLSSQPWIPSSILAFPGSNANKSADTPLIILTILFNDSQVIVFTDLH